MKHTGQGRKKELAIAALLAEPTVSGAATKAGVSRRTLVSWLKDEPFQKSLQEAKREVVSGVSNQLRRSMSAAAEKLFAVMNNKRAPIAVQLSAATRILEIGYDIAWTENIESRIAQLELVQQERRR